jgi:2-hydroxychromene-2-carboxylate isomerase
LKSIPIQFMFDFGSNNAYLCHKVIPALEARTGAVVEYVPVLLGGLFKLSNNRSPAEAFADVPHKRAYDKLEVARFVARHGLHKYRPSPFWPMNTLKVMRGAVAARKQGCFMPYVDAVFAHVWEEGSNMDDAAVIARALDEAGLDGEALLAGTQDADVKSGLLAHTQSAFERGAFGAPTFFVGDEIFFGKDRLREVEEEIVRVSAPSLAKS